MVTSRTPKLSVVTIVYNGARYLEQCIQSVINQTYANYEYIIVDGGSVDGTVDIIRKYEANIHKWVSEADRGLSDAMNKGAGFCSGDYTVFLHSDDVLYSESVFQDVVSEINRNGMPKWITGFYKYLNSENIIIKQDRIVKYDKFSSLMMRNIIRHQATYVQTPLVKQLAFSENYKYAMDYDFFLRLWSIYGAPVYMLQNLAYFRLDGENLSSDYYKSIEDEMRVRMAYRKRNKQYVWIIGDCIIYQLRRMKIRLIHSRKRADVR